MEVARLTTVFDADTQSLDRAFERGERGAFTFASTIKGIGDRVGSVFPNAGRMIDGLSQSFTQLNTRATTFRGVFSSIGAASGGLIEGFSALYTIVKRWGDELDKNIKSAIEAGSRIHDLSIKTGLAAETLSGLDLQLKQSGTSLEAFANSTFFLQRNLLAAADGNRSLRLSFERLGINDPKEALENFDETLKKVAKNLYAISNEGTRNAVGAKVMGRAYKEMSVFMEDTGGNIDAVIEKSRAMGLVMSQDTAGAADRLGDSLEALNSRYAAMKREMGEKWFPAARESMVLFTAHLNEGKKALDEMGTSAARTGGFLNELASIFLFIPRSSTDEARKEVTAEEIISATRESLKRSADGANEALTAAAKKAKDPLRPFKDILKGVTTDLTTFDDKSGEAAVNQRFLDAGVNKLTGSLRIQAEVLKSSALAQLADLNAKKAAKEANERAQTALDALNAQMSAAQERTFELSATAEDGRTSLEKFDFWLRNLKDSSTLTADAISKTRDAFAAADKAADAASKREKARQQSKSALDSMFDISSDVSGRLRGTTDTTTKELDKVYQRVSNIASLRISPDTFTPLTDFMRAVGEPSKVLVLGKLDEIFQNISTGFDPQQLAQFKSQLADAAIAAHQLQAALNQKRVAESFGEIMDDLNSKLDKSNKLTQHQIVLKRLAAAGINDLNSAMAQEALTLADVVDRQLKASKQSKSLREQLEKLDEEALSVGDHFNGMVAGLPEGIGDVFGNAAKNWDGTFRGFFQSVKMGFAEMLQDMAAQMMKAAVTKLLIQLGLSIFGGAAGGAPSGGGGGSYGGWGGHAAGGLVMPKAGGQLIQVAEAGYPEVVLSTDPKYKTRTAALMSDFMRRTSIAPKFAEGGWVERTSHAITHIDNRSYQSIVPSFAAGGWTDKPDMSELRNRFSSVTDNRSYAPNYSRTTNFHAPPPPQQTKHIHLEYREPPRRSGNYIQRRDRYSAMEHFLKNIEKYVNER